MAKNSQKYMREYMREYREGRRRTVPAYPPPTTPDEIEAIKQILRSAERLRAIGVVLK
jgi:hypothetical protein